MKYMKYMTYHINEVYEVIMQFLCVVNVQPRIRVKPSRGFSSPSADTVYRASLCSVRQILLPAESLLLATLWPHVVKIV